MKQEERKAMLQQISGSLQNCQFVIDSFRSRIETMIKKREAKKASTAMIEQMEEKAEKGEKKTRKHVSSE